jgi:bifunctional non-homologous end joining protein LigD
MRNAASTPHRLPKSAKITTNAGSTKRIIGFIPPMLLLQRESLPEGPDWLYEIKLDGYRAVAIKSSGKLQLGSGNDNDFTTRYPAISAALAALPDETIIDGRLSH